jgi:hypothetical protein
MAIGARNKYMPGKHGVSIISADYVGDMAGMTIGQCLGYYDSNLLPDSEKYDV